MPDIGDISASERMTISAPFLESPGGSRPRVPRHGRLDADRATGTGGVAHPARQRAAPVRLRRGDATAAPAVVDRPTRPAGGLPHPLPRRPLPRPAGDAQD